MSNEKKLEKKGSPAKNLTFLLLIVPYQIAVRMEEGGEKKKRDSSATFPAKKLSWIIQIQLLMFIAKY